MGLFGAKRRTSGKHSSTTIVSEGASISGQLALTGSIQIDGQVDGTIRTTTMVTISPSGSVEGKIYADHAIINGQFEGEIFAKNVDVLPNGCLKGEVTSAELTIEKGGSFLGTSKTVSGDEIAEQLDTERQQKQELSIVTDTPQKKTASA